MPLYNEFIFVWKYDLKKYTDNYKFIANPNARISISYFL